MAGYPGYRSDAARRIASFEFATRACDLVFGVMYPLGPSVPRRNLSDRLNPMELYSDRQFLARYRFTKTTVRELLTLLPLQQTGDNRGLPLTPLLQLLVTLRFYGAGTFQMVAGDLVHVSQPTVCRTVRTVTTLIARVLFRRLVHFPAASEYHGVMRDFYAMGQFPGVTGCIDCTHVRIRSPGGDDAEVYRNRKGVFSLNVQAITGPQLQFFDVVASWPGSVHDSRTFDGSRARALYEESRVPGVLLGDMGYACLPFLMTPLANPGAANSPGGRYNKAQIRTRNSVERAFGVWKRRFPCLDMRLQHKTRHSCSIITACAALHNLGRARNEPLPPPPPPPPSPRARNARRRRQPHLPPILPEDSPSGLRIRQNIILLSFT
ncbi:putative nuclease HARBI1 [Ixodes scapularis]|uniref:putative nuclease HARBI1 n=1 Tax=Ixodes scapularis TaxID=6945 RepID=UPI001AD6E35F|nr:putative nuclease HARBI1 [Ixodes scapularis]